MPRIYWSFAAIPELRPFNDDEKRRLLRAVGARVLVRGDTWLGMALGVVFCFVLAVAGIHVSARVGLWTNWAFAAGVPDWVWISAGGLLGGGLAGLLFSQLLVYGIRREVAALLEDLRLNPEWPGPL